MQVLAGIAWRSDDLKAATLASCGRLWVSADAGVTFAPTTHHTYRVRWLAAAWATNDSVTIENVPATGVHFVVGASNTKCRMCWALV